MHSRQRPAPAWHSECAPSRGMAGWRSAALQAAAANKEDAALAEASKAAVNALLAVKKDLAAAEER